MKKHPGSEQGQALIIIVLAIFGVMSLIALAIDGGNVYSDRRQAQNASDSAALAAAMRYAQDQTLTNNDLASIALSRANSNGYKGIAPRSTVKLTILPKGVADCPDAPAGQIFQVDIDSYMPTWFGNIIGVSVVHNHVTSNALGCEPSSHNMFGGNAIVTLNPDRCRVLEFAGSSTTIITSSTGGGIFVNSSCANAPTNPQNALYGGSGTIVSPSTKVVGGVYTPAMFPNLTMGVPVYPADYKWPTVTDAMCGGTATESPSGTLNPGVYPGTKASWAHKTFPPSGITNLAPGLYCLDNDFKTTNTDSLTGYDVTIYQRNGIVSIQGGTIVLTATYATPMTGLLFYLPKSNTGGSISINGGATSLYSGTILAPGAYPGGHVSLNGGGGTTTFKTQVVADTITVGGTGTLNMNYDDSEQYRPFVPAGIQLLK